MKKIINISILVVCLLFIVSCVTTNKYTITYETFGGTFIESENVNEGDFIPYPENPTKEGYEFIGWYLDEGYETEVDFNQTVTEDLTIYAKYRVEGEEQINQITYILNGAINNELNPSTFTKSDLPITLHDPELEGKHFIGWYINGNKIINIPNFDSYNLDITLEARFEDIHKVTYEGFGADTVSNPTEYYSSLGNVSLNIPSIPGYTFLGWNYNGLITSYISSSWSGDIVLETAYYANEYSITYELNGGINNSTNPVNYTVEVETIRLKNPTKEGYIFTGWMLNGQKVEYIDTSIVDNITLVATWEVEPIYHDIIYFLNGGTVNTLYETKYQEGIGLKLPTVTKEGYTFLGWNIENKETSTYITEIPASANTDYTLYAIFSKNIIISNVYFELDGGYFNNDPISSYEEGKSFELPIPMRENYNFIGWYLNSDFSGLNISSITETMKGDLTFYAKWESNIAIYTVTYNLNGGIFTKNTPYSTRKEMTDELLKDINEFYNQSMSYETFFETSYNVSALNNFFNDGTYKEKWSWVKTYILACGMASGYSGQTYLENEADTYYNTYLRANISSFLNASYRSEWPSSIDFSDSNLANGYIEYLPGEEQIIIYSFTEDTETFTLPDVTRNEFTFLGWYDENGNKITEITKGTTHNVVLNAKFKSIYDIYTITYITNGGILSSNTIYEFTERDLVVFTQPKKEGYSFMGWYQTSDFSGSVITDIPVGTKENITVYAKYQAIDYTITYYADGGTHNNITKYNVDLGDIILQPATKVGYKFIGWYTLSGIKLELIAKGTTGKMELYAKYEPIVDTSIKYTVTFINELNEIIRTEEVTHGTCVSEILLGTYEGLQLAWFDDGHLYDFDQKLTSDLTLHARWRVIDDIYNFIFYDTILKENVNITREFETDMGTISIVWRTSNPYAINTATGQIGLDYELQTADVTGTFKLNGKSFTVIRSYTVDKVDFRDLSTGDVPVFGYLYSNVASMQTPQTVLETIDVFNYGFARVTSTGEVDITELRHLEKVAELRKKGIRILLCIGGYGTACKEFSDAALTAEGRSKLASSILNVIEEYHLDGVDIDWEYPGYETGRDVSIDRPNYTLLMAEIRRQLKEANPEYLVTAALPGGKYGYTRYELSKLNPILDYFHLMTYDLQASNKATHHTGLYTGTYTPHGSVEQTVNTFVANGVSRDKLVVGLAFYGRKFNVTSTGSGIGSSNNLSSANSITYTNIYNNYLIPIANGSTTITRYWDDVTKAPYIYDKTTKIWISYDDPESIGYKCQYVLDNNLGGVMFWDYGEDQTYQLTAAIHNSLRK